MNVWPDAPAMTFWHLVDQVTGKLVVASTSREALERECAWRGIILPSDQYQAQPVTRCMSSERWGVLARPSRYAAPWPEAKVEEFVRRYKRLEPIRKLEEHFDSPASSLAQRARRLGLPKRDSDNPKWRRKIARRRQGTQLEHLARLRSEERSVSKEAADWDVRHEALAAMQAADFTLNEMAEYFGRSRNTIVDWLAHLGMSGQFERKCVRCGSKFKTPKPQVRHCTICRNRDIYKTVSQRVMPISPTSGLAEH